MIALAAAMQESSLRNLDYGDRDSLGLFQQRPSAGWGTPAQVTDPVYASQAVLRWPEQSRTRASRAGCSTSRGWQSMTVTQAAQAVQQLGLPGCLREVGDIGPGLAGPALT